ncbi:glycine oxidase ThiO [Roseiarcus sp.]|uniref:glycine oxidase ThiO n=1 Tax=Roseiarcus sp. TaxID=1969460 RepID=UPI003F98DD89
MRATVVGAGVVGLATATALAERGAKVTLIERAENLSASASWLAGGMLAPFCEGESAPPSVVELGRRAIDWWAARAPGVVREGTLVVAPPRDVGEIERFAARTARWERVDEARIAALEPDLAGRFHKGLFFRDEGHIDPRAALQALAERLRARGAEIHFGSDGERLGAGVVVDCRGFAARPHLPELRGVRGEMMRVRSRDVRLTRTVRLLHPRFPLYVVPRSEGEAMIGATMIESGNKGAVAVRSALELLTAVYALHPAFGEAEIVEMSGGVRPAYPDNAPRIEEREGRIFVNGFYRHGFLLAPAFAERAAALAFERTKEHV